MREPRIEAETEKTGRSARDLRGDEDNCRARPGTFKPVIDHSRCEGKRDCLEVCPYGVFEVRRIDDADFGRLSMLARLKSLAHRQQTAYTPNADACQSCGLCVAACPEKAIRLVRS